MHFKRISSLLLPLAINVSAAPQAVTQPSLSTGSAVTITQTIITDVTATSTSTRFSTEVKTIAKFVYCTSNLYVAPAVTVTENATSINTITRVEIASSTTTVNAGATSAVANGLSYKRYTHSFNADLANPGFTASFFKNNIAVLSTGRVNTLTFSGSGGNLQLSDGSPAFEIKQAAIVFKGGFKASQTGTYTFTTTVAKNDNWGWFWIGDVAVNDWNDNNAAYKATRVGSGGFFGGTTSITLRAGEVIPITFLWANGGGAGSTDFTIRLPDGTTTTNGSGYFVESCPST